MKSVLRRAEAVDDFATAHSAPVQMSMDCPDCGAGIGLSLPSLLAARPVWCSGCGARFDVNLDNSADVLRKVSDGLERLRTVRDDANAAARG